MKAHSFLGFQAWCTSSQSYYIEVAQGAILMEQNMRFGLILGRLAILKKMFWADYEQFFLTLFGKK
jgi:hypothetical protein